MKTSIFVTGVLVLAVSIAVSGFLYRATERTAFTMTWDMAAHTFYGAELGQDLRLHRPAAFLHHANTSSIALWPFLHSMILGTCFAVFGFSDTVPIVFSLVVFVMAVMAAYSVGCQTAGNRSVVPGLLAAFFFLSSPILLAYATYPMLEVLGVFLALAVVLRASLAEARDEFWGRAAAISMLLLFLTKINFGLYVFIPWLIYEAISLDAETRKRYCSLLRRFLNPRSPLVIVASLLLLVTIVAWALNNISVSTGNVLEYSIYAFLLVLFLRIVLFHFNPGNETRDVLLSRHFRVLNIVVIPLLVWFLIKPDRAWELLLMSSDRTTGFPLLGLGNLTFYPMAFVRDYCFHWAAGLVLLALFIMAIFRWRSSPPIVRLIVLIVLFGYLGLTFKLRNFAEPRFFILQAAMIFLVAACEIWRIGNTLEKIFPRSRWPYLAAISALVLISIAMPIRLIYSRDIDTIIRESAPTADAYLTKMLRKALAHIGDQDRKIAIIGGSNELNPYLVRWEMMKASPSVLRTIVVPPLKFVENDEDMRKLQKWLRSGEADAIVSLAIAPPSPYAQFPDFKLRHATRQSLVEAMDRQVIYDNVCEERWRSMAVEIRIYKPAKERGPSSSEGPDKN